MLSKLNVEGRAWLDRRAKKKLAGVLLIGLLATALALPASGVPKDRGPARVESGLLKHVSQSVATRYFIEHPDQAPSDLQSRFSSLNEAAKRASGAAVGPGAVVSKLFNKDIFGLPQNEESVSACVNRPRVVLGSTNDYRGLLDPQGNFTGWHLSTNAGRSVRNEGLLPPVAIGGNQVPSGGDPVDVLAENCSAAFASSLNYDPVDPFHNANGIGLYRSTPTRLANCPGGAAPSCWPVRRAVATAEPGHFLDKEWFDYGRSGSAGNVVWAVFADFAIDDAAPLGFTGAEIKAVRCDAHLNACTEQILISGDDLDTQFADVTIAPDGRTYVSWSEIEGELEGTAQTFTHKLRVAPPGSTDFGPTRVVFRETRAIPFGGHLHANDFRVATYAKNEVADHNGDNRVYLTWEACRARLLDTICEEPEIKLTYSDNDGRTWTRPKTVSAGGDNYFPTIAADPSGNRVAVAYFTNRRDAIFDNRQDVELATLTEGATVTNRQYVTPLSNESEADPLLGGFFIGDYIEVFAHNGVVYTHFNANYRNIKLLGEGFPVPQQDNYLDRRKL